MAQQRRRTRSPLVGVALAALTALAACGGSGSTTAAPAASAPAATSAAATASAAASTAAASSSAGGGANAKPAFGQPGQTVGEGAACTSDAGAAYTPTGQLVADSGFRPEVDGLGFPNYGDQICDPSGAANGKPMDLSAAEMRKLFGDVVCSTAPSDTCVLTPPAQAWMERRNAGMAGGHCYGFSDTALQIKSKQVKLADLGGGENTAALTVTPALQRELAYTWSYQTLQSVNDKLVIGTPTEILAKLKESLKPDNPESYTFAFFKRDGTGGHAVTPYAIEDNGDGKFHVLVYDNNYPKLVRAVAFDTKADTWSYSAAINPTEPSALYEGDATTKSIRLDPVTPGQGVQPAPFGGEVTAGDKPSAGSVGSAGGAAASGPALQEITLTSESRSEHAHLLITDPAGKKTGYVDGKMVNEIPHAEVGTQLGADDWKGNEEPAYYVPDGVAYTITIDATSLTAPDAESLGIIGPGYDIAVDGLALQAGDKDTLAFEPGASKIVYTTSRAESPTIQLGVNDAKADYAFTASGVDVPGGGSLTLELPVEGTDLTLTASGTTGDGTYALQMDRTDQAGTKTFKHEDITLAADDTATLQFGSWTGDGQTIPLVVDHAGTKTTTELSDQG